MIRTAAALLFAALGTAQAAPIYRCGADGKTYSQTPCPGGSVVESSDPRTAAQRKEAQRVAAQERQRAAELERERVARERGTKPAGPATLGPTAAAASAAAPAPPHKGKAKPAPKDFVATVPGPKAK